MPALFMGAAAGVLCYLACGKVKRILGYDDSLDAFGVHGVGGLLGAFLTGIFATTEVNPAAADGVFYGGSWELVAAQLAAAGVAIALSVGASFVLLKTIDLTVGLRVEEDAEERGLDLAAHGEEGYVLT